MVTVGCHFKSDSWVCLGMHGITPEGNIRKGMRQMNWHSVYGSAQVQDKRFKSKTNCTTFVLRITFVSDHSRICLAIASINLLLLHEERDNLG